jgi:hypothetical protein
MKNCVSFVCAQQQPLSCHRSSQNIPYTTDDSTDNSASITQMINVLYSKVCRLTVAATNLD